MTLPTNPNSYSAIYENTVGAFERLPDGFPLTFPNEKKAAAFRRAFYMYRSTLKKNKDEKNSGLYEIAQYMKLRLEPQINGQCIVRVVPARQISQPEEISAQDQLMRLMQAQGEKALAQIDETSQEEEDPSEGLAKLGFGRRNL